MLELASPWWLLGLALLPWVRWLHRFRAGERLLRVPALFLWKQAGVSAAPGERRADPDPAWRWRALLVTLLVLALAGPMWSWQSPLQIQIWLDDLPSLFSREADGQSRIDLAADSLSAALAGSEVAEVTLHTLWRPGETRSPNKLDPRSLRTVLHAWLTGPGSGPRPSHLPQPPPDTRRWLVSDGTRPPNPRAFPFHRSIPVGRNTENVALTRLAVRPSLDEPDRSLGLVSALNAGIKPAETGLELDLNGEILERRNLTLAPDEPVVLGFALPRGAAGTLSARLRPGGDALALDDSLQLALGPATQDVALTVSGDCGAAVTAAVEAHPGLRRSTAENPGLRLWCSAEPPSADEPPTLWLLAGAGGDPPTEPPVWSDPTTENPPRLRAAWIRLLPTHAAITGRSLMQAGDRILIGETERPRRIGVLFDLNAPVLAARPELPMLLDLLFERLAGRELLLPTDAAFGDPELAHVAPRPLPVYTADFETALSPVKAAPILMAAALALLLLDLYLGRRREALS